MIPISPGKDIFDGTYGDLKSSCEFRDGHSHTPCDSNESVSKVPYLSHVAVVEFGHRMLLALKGAAKPNSYSMIYVLSVGNVLKILYAVVKLVSVFVVDFFSFWAWPDESQGNEYMDPKLMAGFPIVKDNSAISIAVQAPIKKSLGDTRNDDGPTMPAGVVAPNISKAGYVVQSFVSNDRFPDFSGRISFGHDRLLAGDCVKSRMEC